ncbi:tail-anchored protein insertion receptor WRB-like [Dendronephthya gigantea]|uniref:tail-anchored protein insertion receptor WRB-like n=1 Tax=Dendronephthya gigantea TaxID=151771 RepID=UPI00106D8D43|nr:tail-anchored protein insertion receptor WRB-like [Dendronephthya gigantea]
MVTAVAVFLVVLGLQYFRKFLTDYVTLFLNRPSPDEKQLAITLRELQNELSHINAQHEFAKYAKLKRLISKHEDKFRSQGLQRQKHGLKIKGVLWTVGIAFTVVCHSWIMWNYRSVPLVEMPTDWLAPLNPILKFPTNVDGAIGLPAWLVISNSVIFQLQRMWSP